MADANLRYSLTAQDRTGRAFRSVNQNLRRTDQLVAGLGRRFAAGLAAGAGIAALGRAADQIREALEEFDRIGKRARTAGIGTDLFQGLQLAAEEASVPINLLETSLIAFTKRVGELGRSSSILETNLKDLNPRLLEMLQNADNQEEALQALARAFATASGEAELAALSNAAFGRSGIEVARIFREQGFELSLLVRRAKELGVVIDEELLASAEQMQNEYGILTRQLDTELKQAFIELAPALIETTRGFTSAVRVGREWGKTILDIHLLLNPLTVGLGILRQVTEDEVTPAIKTLNQVMVEQRAHMRGLLGDMMALDEEQGENGTFEKIQDRISDTVVELEKSTVAVEDFGASLDDLDAKGQQVARSLTSAFQSFARDGKFAFEDFLNVALQVLTATQGEGIANIVRGVNRSEFGLSPSLTNRS